jgi:hypothetical protein
MKQKGRWHLLPVGERLHIAEAARIMGIQPNTLRLNYAHIQPRRRAPEYIQFLRENGRTWGILRTA